MKYLVICYFVFYINNAFSFHGIMMAGRCIYATDLQEYRPVITNTFCRWNDKHYFVVELDVTQFKDDTIYPLVQIQFYNQSLAKTGLCLAAQGINQSIVLRQCNTEEAKWKFLTKTGQLEPKAGPNNFHCLGYKASKGLHLDLCAELTNEEKIFRFTELEGSDFKDKQLGSRIIKAETTQCIGARNLPAVGGDFILSNCLYAFDEKNTRQVFVRRALHGHDVLAMPSRNFDIFPASLSLNSPLLIQPMQTQTTTKEFIFYQADTMRINYLNFCLGESGGVIRLLSCEPQSVQKWIFFPELYDDKLHQQTQFRRHRRR